MDIREFCEKLKQSEVVTLTDAELAQTYGMSLRTAQRYVARLKEAGLVESQIKKHLHHAYGWCNERVLTYKGAI